MKRSNRLVLLVGVFLAIVAFVLVALTLGSPSASTEPEKGVIVVATKDLPLGSKLTEDAVTTREVALADVAASSYGDVSKVIGQTIAQSVTAGQEIDQQVLTGSAGSIAGRLEVPAGKRAVSVEVNQVTGVGTLIRPGDYVDLVIALGGDRFPIVTVENDTASPIQGVNSTSVKILLQGMQVLGTLLPTPTEAQQQQGTDESTSLTGRNQIVILAVDAQQAEVIKYAQVDGDISLVLRSSADFIDPVTGEPIPVPADATTGTTLRILVDTYGVVVPELVEGILP